MSKFWGVNCGICKDLIKIVEQVPQDLSVTYVPWLPIFPVTLLCGGARLYRSHDVIDEYGTSLYQLSVSFSVTRASRHQRGVEQASDPLSDTLVVTSRPSRSQLVVRSGQCDGEDDGCRLCNIHCFQSSTNLTGRSDGFPVL